MRQDFRAHALAPDIVANRFGEQARYVPVSLVGERLELVPDVLVDFRVANTVALVKGWRGRLVTGAPGYLLVVREGLMGSVDEED